MSVESSSEEQKDAADGSNAAESEEEEENAAIPDGSEPVPPEGQGSPESAEVSAAENEEEQSAPDWLINNIAELSKNARSIYLIYLGFLAYCSITVVSTSDRQILLNDSVRLPLIGVDVSFTGFFVIAPLVAIGMFVYLQLYLQRLK